MKTNLILVRRNAHRKPCLSLLIPIITVLMAAPDLRAANGTWTNLLGAGGTNLVPGDASGSWANVTNWNNGIIATDTDGTADFSAVSLATNSTVTLDEPVTIGNLIFGGTAPGANWTLTPGTGGTLTLNVTAGAPVLTANDGSNVISTVIAGTNGFTKAGAGTLRLNGANSALYGNLNIAEGILQAGSGTLGATMPNNSTVISNAIVVAPGATLGVIAGQAPNLKTVYIGGTGAGGTQGAIYTDLGPQPQGNSSTRLSISLTSVASPAVIVTNDATIRVDGTSTSALAATMLIGQITTSNALTGVAANDTNYTLTKTGMGQLRIDPANGFTGGNIHLVEGSLAFGNNGDLPGYQTLTLDPGTFVYCRNVTSLNSANSTLVVNGLMDLDARGNGNHGSDTTTANQTIGYLSGSGIVTNGSAGNVGVNTLVIGGTDGRSTTFSGTLAACANGSVGLRLQNTGSTLRLTGGNTYQGATVINSGSLMVNGTHIGGSSYLVNGAGTLGGLGTISAATFTNNGGTLVAGDPESPGGALTISNNIIAAAPGLVIISNATLAVNGAIGAAGQSIGNLYLTNGTLQIPLNTQGPSAFVSALNVDGNATIAYSMTTPLLGQYPIISYSSIGGLAGFNGLTLVNPPGFTATLSNNAANPSGPTIDVVITHIPVLTWSGVPDGDWDIGTTTNWQGGVAYTEPGGVGLLVLFDDTAPGTTSVNLTTTLTPEGVTVNNDALNYTFYGSGHLTGATGIAKQGSGTLTVANNGNDFTGGVALQAGTLQLGNGGTSGDLGSGPIANQGTLVLDRSDNFTLANTVSGNGNLTQTGAGAAVVPVSGDSSGAVTVSAGTLQLAPGGTSTFSGNVTGSGAFGVNGAGTLVLSGTGNNYAGGTVISNGTLQFGDGLGNGAFPPAGVITDDGTLALALSDTLANSVTGRGGVSVIDNATATFGAAQSYSGPTVVSGTSGSVLNASGSTYPAGSALTLGDPVAGTGYGAVYFTDGNPVLGGLTAGGNNQSPGDTVNFLGGGQVLTVNGNLSVGSVGPSGASVLLQPTGSGVTLLVNTNGGAIQIGLGATGSGVNPDNVLVDFSGIDNFIADLGTNADGVHSVLNLGTLDGNPGPSAGASVVNQFHLAGVSNSITAGTITIGAGGRQLTPDLWLGPGTNILNVGTLNVGTGGRDGGILEFNPNYSGVGGVQIRGAASGDSRANFNQGVNATTGTGAGFATAVNFGGGYADLRFGPMVIGNEPARGGQWTNTFAFGDNGGVLDATSVALSQGARSGADYTVMNLNGGTASLGPVSLTASAAGGELNLNTATVTVQSISHSGAGTSSLNINGSSLNVDIQGFGNPSSAPISVGDFNVTGFLNLGVNGTGLAVGQFPLISYTNGIGGDGFIAINLASLPANVSGYLSNNTANASVDLVITAAPPAINPYPTNIAVSVSGSQLTLKWDNSHLGWLLQSNAVGLINTDAWMTVTGSDTTNQFNFTMDPSATNVFFRMLKP